MPGTVADGPTVSMSCMWYHTNVSLNALTIILVANNFWGKEDAGLQPMLDRVHGSKITNDELKVFYGST